MTKVEIDILKKALFIIGREEVEAYKALPDEEVIFSKEFAKKAYAINKRRKSLFYRTTRTVPRKIAVILIAAVITFTMMMSVSAIRTHVLNFVISIYDTYISIYFQENDQCSNSPQSIENILLPHYSPNDYLLLESNNYETTAQSLWLNEEDESLFIILDQDVLTSNSNIHISNENSKYQAFKNVNNYDVYYNIEDGYYFFIWSNGSYLFTMTCPDNIPLSEIEKIIGSME